MNRNSIIYIGLGIYWAALFVVTSLPSQSLPSIRRMDKLGHFGAFFLLGGLLLIVAQVQSRFRFLSRKPVLFSIVIVLGYAVLDEVHQKMVPGRTCDIRDLIADFLGIVTGVCLTYFLFGNWIRRNKSSGADS